MLNHYGWNSMDGPCPLSDCSSIAQWGQLGAVTQPTIGNHEYQASPATNGSAWQDYWHQRPSSMSFTFANTLFIDLNCGPKAALCDFGVGSTQYMSVTNLLSAPHPPCVVSYWHIPALSKNIAQKDLTPMWKLLTDNGGTMVLNGHVHHMEEYLNLNDQMQTATAGQPTMAQLIAGSGDVSKVQASDPRMTWPTYPQQGVQGIPGALYLTLNGAANGGHPASISYSFEGVNHNPLRSNTVPCGGLPAITGFTPDLRNGGHAGDDHRIEAHGRHCPEVQRDVRPELLGRLRHADHRPRSRRGHDGADLRDGVGIAGLQFLELRCPSTSSGHGIQSGVGAARYSGDGEWRPLHRSVDRDVQRGRRGDHSKL